VVFGRGESYGAEVLLEKKVGQTSGWVGYTLSWTTRQFDDLNFGEPFPYLYDRRHDIGAAVTHKFNERIDVGVVWVYGTGNALTLAQERYQGIFDSPLDNFFNSNVGIQTFPERNNFRMPAYHRLDIGVNFHKQKRLFERTWSIGVYNAYNRQNPFFLYFDYDQNNQRKLYQISLFPLIPSVAYSFKF